MKKACIHGGAAAFKQTYCRKCVPCVIGVWDTVASLGYFLGKKFFDDDLHGKITYGYQAAAIDEKRKKFPISLWHEKNITPDQTIEQVWFPYKPENLPNSYKVVPNNQP